MIKRKKKIDFNSDEYKYAHLFFDHDDEIRIENNEPISKTRHKYPYFAIFNTPKSVIRQVIDENSILSALIISSMAGITYALGNARSVNMGFHKTILEIVGSSLLIGIVGGVLGTLLFAYVLFLLKRIFGGNATYGKLVIAVGWAQMPTAATLVLWLVSIAAFDIDYFMNIYDVVSQNMLFFVLFSAVMLLTFLAKIWQIFVMISAVAEAEGFNNKKSLFSVILGIGIIVILFTILSSMA